MHIAQCTHPFKTIETSLVRVFQNVNNTDHPPLQHHDKETYFEPNKYDKTVNKQEGKTMEKNLLS